MFYRSLWTFYNYKFLIYPNRKIIKNVEVPVYDSVWVHFGRYVCSQHTPLQFSNLLVAKWILKYEVREEMWLKEMRIHGKADLQEICEMGSLCYMGIIY